MGIAYSSVFSQERVNMVRYMCLFCKSVQASRMAKRWTGGYGNCKGAILRGRGVGWLGGTIRKVIVCFIGGII